jgi:hypothetical protein
MGLVFREFDNKLVQWRAKSHQIDVFLNDASGKTSILSECNGYFYAKKYPVDNSADLDISIGQYSKDISKGLITFYLLPAITDISAGDYLYEVQIKDSNNHKITVLQDRFSVSDSMELSYSDLPLSVIPASHLFTIWDESEDYSVTSLAQWETVSKPDWIEMSPSNGTSSTDGSINKSDSDLSNRTGSILLRNAVGNEAVIDVSFYYSDLVLNPSSFTFTPNSSVLIDVSTSDINSWVLSGIPSWLAYDISSGTGASSILLEASIITNKVKETIDVDSDYSYPKTLDVSFYFSSTLSVDSSNPFPFSLDTRNHTFTVTTGSLNPWTLILPSWLSSDVSGGLGSGTFNLTVNDLSQSHSPDEIKVESYYANEFVIDSSYTYNPIITANGEKTSIGDWDYYVFYDSSSFIISTNYTNTIDVSLFFVAGGGGGGKGYESGVLPGAGGGGGGGEIKLLNNTLSTNTPYSLIVGDGGAAGTSSNMPGNGGHSYFNNIKSHGGGAAGGWANSAIYNGADASICAGGGAAGYKNSANEYSLMGSLVGYRDYGKAEAGRAAATSTTHYIQIYGSGGGSNRWEYILDGVSNGFRDPYDDYGGAAEGIVVPVLGYIGSGGPAGGHGIMVRGTYGRGGRGGWRMANFGDPQKGGDGVVMIGVRRP